MLNGDPAGSPGGGGGGGSPQLTPRTALAPLPGVLNGWQLLLLGVGYVISGDYAGWQYALEGGWVGAMVSLAVAFLLYLSLVICLAELSTALRASTFGIVDHAFGHFAGYVAAVSVAIEYICIPATVSIFIGQYLSQYFAPEAEMYERERLKGKYLNYT